MKVRIYQINDERDTFLVKYRNYENLEYVKSKAKTFNVSFQENGISQAFLINTFSEDFAKIFFEQKHPDAKLYGIKEAKAEDFKLSKTILGTLEGPVVDSAIYDKIYDGEIEGHNLEDVYRKFNIDHPEDFRGHSLSVSDVVEIYESECAESGFYFCDTIGFEEIDFNPELCQESRFFNNSPEKNSLKDKICEAEQKAKTSTDIKGNSKEREDHAK